MKKSILLLFACLLYFAQDRAQSPNSIKFDDSSYKGTVFIDTVNYHHNIWQIGAPHKAFFTSAYSLPNAIVTDTANPIPPNDTSVFYLKILAYWNHGYSGWGSFQQIEFMYEVDKDPGTKLTIEMGSDSNFVLMNIDSCVDSMGMARLPYSLPCPTRWYSDTDSVAWQNFQIMNGYGSSNDSTDSVVFKFTITTDSVVGSYDGWMIDDIFITYYSEAVPKVSLQCNELTIAPQPAHNLIYINDKKDRSYNIRLINMMGNEVLNQTLRGMSETIDVSRLQTGMYEAVIQDDTGQRYYDKVVVEH